MTPATSLSPSGGIKGVQDENEKGNSFKGADSLNSLGIKTPVVIGCLVSFLMAMTPADKDEYERLGLSQIEWELILNAKMPKSKVYELLKCGISIMEYFSSPWLACRISEDEWIHRRKAGETSSEIRNKEQQKEAEAHRVSKDQWLTIQGFFLPGLHQLLRKEPIRGYFMSGICVLSLGLFAYQTTKTKTFQPLGLFFLVPDMLWSGVDLGIQIQREQNPEASRFTRALNFPAHFELTLMVPLYCRPAY